MSLSVADESTSKSLLAGLRVAEPIAWVRVAKVYGPLIEHWCRRSRLAEHEIGDVTNEVLIKVITKTAEFRRNRPRDSFRGWLWKVTRNQMIEAYRNSRRFATLDNRQLAEIADADGFTPDEPPEVANPIPEAVREAMEIVRQSVTSRTWAIFMLSVAEERSNLDIAEQFETTEANVRQIKWRISARIRDTLELTDDSADLSDPQL